MPALLAKPIGRRKKIFEENKKKNNGEVAKEFPFIFQIHSSVVSYLTSILNIGHQVVPMAAGQLSKSAKIDLAYVLTYDSLGVTKELNGLLSTPLGWHSS